MPWWRGDQPIRSDRRFRFDVAPDDLWRRMADTDSYRAQWSWLREFTALGLVEGDTWRCRVQPPAPYTVRFTVTLDEVDEGRRVAGTVRGDIVGTAELRLRPLGGGSEAHLTSSLAPRHPALRALALVGRPFVRLGHDWVLDTGARQFRDEHRSSGDVQGRGPNDR